MDKKFQIFISSTFDDLKEERSKVVATILKSNHFPIGMEMFSADNVEQWEQIRRTIDSSDYYILIIKRRYGTLTKEGISYTEKEYNYAMEKKVPVLAFIVSEEAAISNKHIEHDIKKIELLNKFVERVKSKNPCDFWSSIDELCTQVNKALQKQFDTNERVGWVRDNTIGINEHIEKLNEETIYQIKKQAEYEIVRRNEDIRLAYDFLDNINERIIHSIKKQTYIDNFNREIILDIQEKNLKVSITTRIQFINVKNGISYYCPNPRFETLVHAKSYRHEEFSINNVDYTKQIVSTISETNENRQFPYIVKNQFPLKYDSNVLVVHKTSHIIPVNQFFHVYQLVFPCRSFLTTILLKNNQNNKYYLKSGTFSAYNVHVYEKYTTEYRKDDVCTITIGKWSLPGSGYTIVLQENE